VENQLAWVIAGVLGTWLSLAGMGRAQESGPVPPDERAVNAARLPQSAFDAAPPPVFSQAAIDAALARHAQEPSVAQVVHAALLAAPSPRAAAAASRARAAAWLPRVGLRARRGQTVDLTAPQSLDPETLRFRSNDDLALEATLTFELDRVVFRHEEIALLRRGQAEQQARERMVREVIRLYFERRHLQLARDLEGDLSLERSVRIVEIEALLDAFTNGSFRRMIAEKSWTTGASTPASTSRSSPKSKSPTTR
jgi:hypothetical protein